MIFKKPCAKCRINLTTEKYCEKCLPKIEAIKKKQMQRYDDSRGNSGERGYGADWQKVRKRQLEEYPLCQCSRCAEMGRTRPADTVHHIVPIETDPDLRLDSKNLMSMSWACHEVEEHRRRDREYEEWANWRLL